MNNKKHLILELITFILIITVPVMSQTNRALIIAISDYQIENGWDKTHAINDCELVIPMLKSNGYKQSNIKILRNEQATKMNIVKELKSLAEISEKEDYIYIHFSGHGQQMVDDNGDEADFLDEAFIPYDAYYRYKPGIYEGEKHLRDDELECQIESIRRKIGTKGNVTVVMDACHSGTGTRVTDEDYIRGTSYVFGIADFDSKQTKKEAFRLNLQSGNDLSPITVFSACQPDELNFEYRKGIPAIYYGSLSFFFCEAVSEQIRAESNHEFYLRLKNKMEFYFKKRNIRQSPYFESTVSDSSFRINK